MQSDIQSDIDFPNLCKKHKRAITNRVITPNRITNSMADILAEAIYKNVNTVSTNSKATKAKKDKTTQPIPIPIETIDRGWRIVPSLLSVSANLINITNNRIRETNTINVQAVKSVKNTFLKKSFKTIIKPNFLFNFNFIHNAIDIDIFFIQNIKQYYQIQIISALINTQKSHNHIKNIQNKKCEIINSTFLITQFALRMR